MRATSLQCAAGAEGRGCRSAGDGALRVLGSQTGVATRAGRRQGAPSAPCGRESSCQPATALRAAARLAANFANDLRAARAGRAGRRAQARAAERDPSLFQGLAHGQRAHARGVRPCAHGARGRLRRLLVLRLARARARARAQRRRRRRQRWRPARRRAAGRRQPPRRWRTGGSRRAAAGRAAAAEAGAVTEWRCPGRPCSREAPAPCLAGLLRRARPCMCAEAAASQARRRVCRARLTRLAAAATRPGLPCSACTCLGRENGETAVRMEGRRNRRHAQVGPVQRGCGGSARVVTAALTRVCSAVAQPTRCSLRGCLEA